MTFTYTPDFGAQVTKRPEVRSVKFSDGYEQRVSFGINTTAQVWDLRWAYRDDTEAGEIDAFFSARRGVDSFSWTPPGSPAPLKFICREWNRTLDENNLNTIAAKFEQVFDLGV
jgi:phage-related protein